MIRAGGGGVYLVHSTRATSVLTSVVKYKRRASLYRPLDYFLEKFLKVMNLSEYRL